MDVEKKGIRPKCLYPNLPSRSLEERRLVDLKRNRSEKSAELLTEPSIEKGIFMSTETGTALTGTTQRIYFVLSPIGKKKNEINKLFVERLDNIIKQRFS